MHIRDSKENKSENDPEEALHRPIIINNQLIAHEINTTSRPMPCFSQRS